MTYHFRVSAAELGCLTPAQAEALRKIGSKPTTLREAGVGSVVAHALCRHGYIRVFHAPKDGYADLDNTVYVRTTKQPAVDPRLMDASIVDAKWKDVK